MLLLNNPILHDAAIFKSTMEKINIGSSNIYFMNSKPQSDCIFYENFWPVRGLGMSFRVLGCNNPTYYPSFIIILYRNNVVGLVVVSVHCLACPQLSLTSCQGH